MHSLGLCIEIENFNLEAIIAIHCRLAISKRGGGGEATDNDNADIP